MPFCKKKNNDNKKIQELEDYQFLVEERQGDIFSSGSEDHINCY